MLPADQLRLTSCAVNSPSVTSLLPTYTEPLMTQIPRRIGSVSSIRRIIVSPGIFLFEFTVVHFQEISVVISFRHGIDAEYAAGLSQGFDLQYSGMTGFRENDPGRSTH